MSHHVTFWFGARKYAVRSPSMTMAEIVKMVGASTLNLVYRDTFGVGQDVPVGHGEAVDLRGEPHFYCVPAATTHRGCC